MLHSRLLKSLYRRFFSESYHLSFSQTGEDLIIDFLRNAKSIKDFSYLDIGCNHPVNLNNTFLFYKKGYRGVIVEPDPRFHNIIKRKRPNDILLGAGIGLTESTKSDFFILSDPLLNTFSENEAQRICDEYGYKIEKVIQVEQIHINDILHNYFKNDLTFLSLDVEGLDYQIIRSIDFDACSPVIICVETVEFTNDATSKKNESLISHLNDHGYKAFADTYVNTIFLSENYNFK